MKLHIDPSAFRELLTATAEFLKIHPRFVEKDYWLTTVLRELAHSPYSQITVFKGGTSLSKAYGIIQRFSEDVDLALLVEGLSGNQVKSRIDSISKGITKHLPEVPVEDITSKGSRFRRTAHTFPSVLQTLVFPVEARQELILEINSFANPSPFSEVVLQSFIGEFLSAQGREDIMTQYGLEPFQLQVLAPSRTLAEKVLALARASSHPQPLEQLQDKIRHVYDLYCLLQRPEIQDFVTGEAFFETLRDVQADDADRKSVV